MIASAGCTPQDTSTTARDDVTSSDTGTVTLKIQINEESPTVIDVPEVSDGATLETVMRSLDDIDIGISGSGTTAFVNSIQGKETSADKGWTFQIDGEHANQGIGTTVLHPPTTVEWSFGSFADTMQ